MCAAIINMTDINQMLNEMVRIAEKAWIVAHQDAYAEAWRQQFETAVSTASEVASGVDAVTATGAVLALAALLVPKLTHRHFPSPIHVVLRAVATGGGLVDGVALTYPLTTAVAVGMWAMLGLQALAHGVLPWTTTLFFRASVMALKARDLHPMMWREVIGLELGFLQQLMDLYPIPTAVAVLLSVAMSAMVARCVQWAFACLTHLAGMVLERAVAFVVSLFVAVVWSMPLGAIRLVMNGVCRGVTAAAGAVGAVRNVVVAAPVVPTVQVSFLERVNSGLGIVVDALKKAVNDESKDVVTLHDLVTECCMMIDGAKIFEAVTNANPEPLADFDFLLTKVNGVDARQGAAPAVVVAPAPVVAAPRFRAVARRHDPFRPPLFHLVREIPGGPLVLRAVDDAAASVWRQQRSDAMYARRGIKVRRSSRLAAAKSKSSAGAAAARQG